MESDRDSACLLDQATASVPDNVEPVRSCSASQFVRIPRSTHQSEVTPLRTRNQKTEPENVQPQDTVTKPAIPRTLLLGRDGHRDSPGSRSVRHS